MKDIGTIKIQGANFKVQSELPLFYEGTALQKGSFFMEETVQERVRLLVLFVKLKEAR